MEKDGFLCATLEIRYNKDRQLFWAMSPLELQESQSQWEPNPYCLPSENHTRDDLVGADMANLTDQEIKLVDPEPCSKLNSYMKLKIICIHFVLQSVHMMVIAVTPYLVAVHISASPYFAVANEAIAAGRYEFLVK